MMPLILGDFVVVGALEGSHGLLDGILELLTEGGFGHIIVVHVIQQQGLSANNLLSLDL